MNGEQGTARASYFYGTERACAPEETLARLLPLFDRVGITRLADVTQLDRLGVPTYQAVRPLARSLSVSQGKGLTPAAAKASAVMESIELWHSETAEPASLVATVDEAERLTGYPAALLPLSQPSFLHPGLRVQWTQAVGVLSGRKSLVPTALVVRDRRWTGTFSPPVFRTGSNGLAGGNNVAEATLHALFELVERDSAERARQSGTARARPVDLASVTFEPCRAFSAKCEAEGVFFELFDLTGPTGVPVLYASVWSADLPVYFMGWGCHLNRDIAVARAFTEAAQSRLTAIAGARDDMEPVYHWARAVLRRPASSAQPRSYDSIPSHTADGFISALRFLAGQVEALTGHEPLSVDLTRADIAIPVV
ncbi:MAG TPA: YcaO-like family protein, partial [Allosphingosinicella sp.]